MLVDPHYLARGMVQRIVSRQGWDVPVTGVVPRFSRTPGTIRSAGPLLGEHTTDVLRQVAGLAEDEIAALADADLIG